MPKQKIEGLISSLHERLTNEATSPQQEALLNQMQSHLQEWQGPPAPVHGDLEETAEQLYLELEDTHPSAAHLVTEIIETLRHIGL